MNGTLDLRRHLESLAGTGPVWFRPNPGNAGDSLIALAAFQLFRALGIEIRLLRRAERFEPDGQTLLYGGGGNLVHLYRGDPRDTIGRFHRRLRRLTLLPSTISGHGELLAELGGNVEIVCRERVSLRYVTAAAPSATVLLADDLAFSLDTRFATARAPRSPLALLAAKLRYRLARDERQHDVPSPRRMARSLPRLAALRRAARRERVLEAFRSDREGGGRALPESNVDLSELCAFGAQSEPLAEYSSHLLLRSLVPFERVRTDRLHVAIASALLGKEVQFFANSYFKCRAVFEQSMAGRFPNVRWMGDAARGA